MRPGTGVVLRKAYGGLTPFLWTLLVVGGSAMPALAGLVTGSVLEHAIAASAAQLGVAAGALTPAQTTAALLNGYHVNFFIFAALYVVAFLCWFKIDPTRPIAPVDSGNPQEHASPVRQDTVQAVSSSTP